MKRLFTFAIVAMIASLTFAQAQVTAKRAATRIERVVDGKTMKANADKAQTIQAVNAEKAAAAQEFSTSVLRKAIAKPLQALNARGIEMGVQLGNVRPVADFGSIKARIQKKNAKLANRTAVKPAVKKAPRKAEGDEAVFSESFACLSAGSIENPVAITLDEDDCIPEDIIGEDSWGWGGDGLYQAGGACYINIVDDDGWLWSPWFLGGYTFRVEFDAYALEESDVMVIDWADFETGNNDEDYAMFEGVGEWQHFSFTIDASEYGYWYFWIYTIEGDCAVKNFAIYLEEHEPGEVVVTKDAHGIITKVTGDSKFYQRAATGTTYTYSNSSGLSYAYQSGYVEVIEDGDNVYIKDPLNNYKPGSWIKGEKSGNTISCELRQPLAYNATYDATLSLNYGSYANGLKLDNQDGETINFTIDGETISLDGTASLLTSSDARVIGLYWDDDDSFQGYWDAETVLSLDDNYEAPSLELVELPAGATTETWYLNGYNEGGDKIVLNREVKVAVVGDELYIQGISENFASAWIKGDINGSSVIFPKIQYMGDRGTYNCWYTSINDASALCDGKAQYYTGTQEIAFSNDVLVNADAYKVYYLEWLSDVVITAEPAEEPAITDLTATLPYLNTFETADEQEEAAIYDGNHDGSTFSFVEDGDNGNTARYRYHSSNDADDYVVFPGLALEAGKAYKVSVDARSYSATYPERFEVVAGTVAKASDLNIPVIAAQDVASGTYTTYSNAEFTVAEAGTYFFAVHAISDPDEFYLYIDNFAVALADDSAPAAVADLAVEADATGANIATITFTVPNATIGGEAITGDVDVVIKRGTEEVASQAAAAGSAFSFVDNVPAPGFYTYVVTTAKDGHISDAASLKAYIGVDTPDAVENLQATDKTTMVGLTWEAPTTGKNNGIVLPDELVYNAYPVELIEFWGFVIPSIDTEHPYATGITATSYDVAFDTNEGEQGFSYFAVTAQSAAGEGDGVYTALLTGAPYTLPVRENLEGGALKNDAWFVSVDPEMDEYTESSVYIDQEHSSDGDGCCFQVYADEAGWVEFQSGKIALGDAAVPVVAVDYMAEYAGASMNIYVQTPDGTRSAIEMIDNVPTTDFATVSASLKGFADEPWIRVAFKCTFDDANAVYLDNIKIYNQLDDNLAVVKIAAPAKVNAGENINVAVTIENQGANAAEGYTVDLYIDGEKAQTAEGEAIAADAKATVEFTVATNALSPEALQFFAKIEYAADEDAENNTSATVTTNIKGSKLPVAENLAAEANGEGVSLTWSEPNLEAAPAEAITDDFEGYDSFAINEAGDWTFVDGDGSETYAFQGISFTNAYQPMAYMVFDNTEFIDNLPEVAHSGNKVMACFAATEPANDDWMISPALYGDAQTVSFFAKSHTIEYGNEEFRFLYSTTDKAIDSFIVLGEVHDVPEEWTEYSYELPAGAKYFAIHCVSNDRFIFLVDDVTYAPAGAVTADLAIVGYNIYRDGQKINAEPVAETEYVDSDLEDGTYTYVVTVVYTEGESKGSNEVAVEFVASGSGINDITVDSDATLFNVQGMRINNPVKGSVVIRVNGDKVMKQIAK